MTEADASRGKLDALRRTIRSLVEHSDREIADLGKTLESQLDPIIEMIDSTNRTTNHFISVIAHELKIPMTSIRGYAELIRQGNAGPVNEQQIRFLDNILSNIDRMAAMVSDISEISQLESGKLKINQSEVQLREYLNETVAGFQNQTAEKNQTIQFELPDRLPLVLADRTRLVQILTHLLKNASQYSPEDGAIVISAQSVKQQVKVWVSDDGIGMEPEEQVRVFTHFYRGDHPIVREHPGLGLGLYTARKLVELMGGEIGVESKPGEGSRFWFTIPMAQPKKS